jgi:6-O-methylguanine DNA methyltransferase, DNA binding domain
MKTAAPGSGCTRGSCNGTVFGGIDFLNSSARTGVRARALCLIFLVEASQSARHNRKKEHIMSRSHRVVRNDGGLSGYRWGVARKRPLLAKEAHA